MGSNAMRSGLGDEHRRGEEGRRETTKHGRAAQPALGVLGAEEMAWGDAGCCSCLPGPGLGGPPVRSTGTPEQKKRFFGVFKDMTPAPLNWGAYGLTEPGAGSDVAGIRTSCRKDGKHWVLNGRKCYITNGARAIWTVIFATVDPALGRAGHRAFVVEKGTPGFAVGKIEEKMGLRASETAELVLEDCRVPEENLLGGEEHYALEGGLHDRDEDLRQHAADGRRDGRRHRPRRVRVRARLREGELRARRGRSRATRRSPSGSRGSSRELDAARMLVWRAAWMADDGHPERQGGEHGQGLRRPGRDRRRASTRSRSAAREGSIATSTSSSRSGSATSRSTTSSRARGTSSASSSRSA